MYVCIWVCMYSCEVCIYVKYSVYVCMYVCGSSVLHRRRLPLHRCCRLHHRPTITIGKRKYVYVCMYVCMCVCVYVCMCMLCMYVWWHLVIVVFFVVIFFASVSC